MTCTVATDASGVVEYWFECYDAPSYNSAWITANTWTTPAMGIQGLNLGFRVKARDAYGNETAWSEAVDCSLDSEVDFSDGEGPVSQGDDSGEHVSPRFDFGEKGDIDGGCAAFSLCGCGEFVE